MAAESINQILSDTQNASQAENITTVVKAAGVNVEPYWPGLFAKLFEKKSIADLITNVGAGGSPDIKELRQSKPDDLDLPECTEFLPLSRARAAE